MDNTQPTSMAVLCTPAQTGADGCELDMGCLSDVPVWAWFDPGMLKPAPWVGAYYQPKIFLPVAVEPVRCSFDGRPPGGDAWNSWGTSLQVRGGIPNRYHLSCYSNRFDKRLLLSEEPARATNAGSSEQEPPEAATAAPARSRSSRPALWRTEPSKALSLTGHFTP